MQLPFVFLNFVVLAKPVGKQRKRGWLRITGRYGPVVLGNFLECLQKRFLGGEGNRVVRIMNFSRDILYWNLLSL